MEAAFAHPLTHAQFSVIVITHVLRRIFATLLEKWFPFVRERLIPTSMHEQIQNQNAFAFLHLLVSNRKQNGFCQCAGITHCLAKKVATNH